MAEAETTTHEMHLPHGSIWPIQLAGAFTLALLAIVFQGIWLPIALLAWIYIAIGWVREDINWYRDSVGTGEGVGRWGTLLFIGSEVMIFGALFATYFNFRERAPMWPPEGMPHLPIASTAVFTIILLFSGVTMHWAHTALRRGEMGRYKGHLLLTIALGAIFMYGQASEYLHLIHEGMTLQSHPYGTTFYMLTGTHGLHVLAGLVFLIIVAIRSFGWGQQDQERHTALEAAALYWHFVDLVWVFVLAVVYFQVV